MEDKKYSEEENREQEGKSSFDFMKIISTVILYWYWFILSIIICTGLAAIYLRYATPIYEASAKLLIKDQDDNNGYSRKSSLQNMANLGIISNSTGIDNEMEILRGLTRVHHS